MPKLKQESNKDYDILDARYLDLCFLIGLGFGFSIGFGFLYSRDFV